MLLFKKIQTTCICMTAAMLTSCSFAPVTPRVDASSVGKDVFEIQSFATPSPSIGLIFGASENLDVGLELEQIQLGVAWARYSFINNPRGFSLATNAAVFIGGDTDKRSNGWYGGLIASNQVSPRFRWTASYRYALLDYEYSLNNSGGYFSTLDFNNPDDASVNGHLDVSLTIRVKSHYDLSLGGACQFLYKNRSVTEPSQACAPIVGFTYFR